jgi:hypothetical protein
LQRFFIDAHDCRQQAVVKFPSNGCGDLHHISIAGHLVQSCDDEIFQGGRQFVQSCARADLRGRSGEIEHCRFASHSAEFFDEEWHARATCVDLSK